MVKSKTVTAYSLQNVKNALSTKDLIQVNFRQDGQTAPSFTGATAQLTLIQDSVPYALRKKMRSIFRSTKDAQRILLKHKLALSTAENVEEDCITALDSSKKLPNLFYKREDKTTICAYKVRGALYQMSKIIEENPSVNLSFFAASTGNHALGVLKSAEILNLSNVTICVPENVAEFKRQKLKKRVLELNIKGLNAMLLVQGMTFEQTNQIAQNLASQNENSFYIDPYNNHNAVAGQGTIGLELLSQLNQRLSENVERLTVIVPIGGGGLISGISCALKEGMTNFSNLKGLKLNVVGVKLDNLNSVLGDAIKVTATGIYNQEFISELVGEKVKFISDEDMRQGMDFINNDIKAKIEGPSAGTFKPLFDGTVSPSEKHAVVCILSGGNVV